MVLFFGLLLFGGVFFMFIGTIWNIIKCIISLIYYSILAMDDKKNIKRLEESGYLQRKQMEAKIQQAEKESKHKEQILNQQNKIIQAALSKTREMRIRYPYADEELFQLILKKFPSYSISELQELELRIKKNHEENELNCSINPINQKTYTLNDINGLECLEEDREDPLIMRIYKPDNLNYLLHIKDIDTNANQLLQSKDYLTIIRTKTKIIEKQRALRIIKDSIKAHDIDEIYNDVQENVRSFRRNRMGFLD